MSENPAIPSLLLELNAIIAKAALVPADQKALLKKFTELNWPEPLYQKADVSTGIAITFKELGIQKVLLLKPGLHYKGPRYDADPANPKYMPAGGYLDLSKTRKTTTTLADANKPEDPAVGAIAELDEELVDDQGNPVLTIRHDRLKPIYTKTIPIPGNPLVVIGFMLELTPDEVKTVRAHVDKLESDSIYRRAVRERTKNPQTNEPEVCTASIVSMKELLEKKHVLLTPGQLPLFEKAAQETGGAFTLAA